MSAVATTEGEATRRTLLDLAGALDRLELAIRRIGDAVYVARYCPECLMVERFTFRDQCGEHR